MGNILAHPSGAGAIYADSKGVLLPAERCVHHCAACAPCYWKTCLLADYAGITAAVATDYADWLYTPNFNLPAHLHPGLGSDDFACSRVGWSDGPGLSVLYTPWPRYGNGLPSPDDDWSAWHNGPITNRLNTLVFRWYDDGDELYHVAVRQDTVDGVSFWGHASYEEIPDCNAEIVLNNLLLEEHQNTVVDLSALAGVDPGEGDYYPYSFEEANGGFFATTDFHLYVKAWGGTVTLTAETCECVCDCRKVGECDAFTVVFTVTVTGTPVRSPPQIDVGVSKCGGTTFGGWAAYDTGEDCGIVFVHPSYRVKRIDGVCIGLLAVIVYNEDGSNLYEKLWTIPLDPVTRCPNPDPETWSDPIESGTLPTCVTAIDPTVEDRPPCAECGSFLTVAVHNSALSGSDIEYCIERFDICNWYTLGKVAIDNSAFPLPAPGVGSATDYLATIERYQVDPDTYYFIIELMIFRPVEPPGPGVPVTRSYIWTSAETDETCPEDVAPVDWGNPYVLEDNAFNTDLTIVSLTASEVACPEFVEPCPGDCYEDATQACDCNDEAFPCVPSTVIVPVSDAGIDSPNVITIPTQIIDVVGNCIDTPYSDSLNGITVFLIGYTTSGEDSPTCGWLLEYHDHDNALLLWRGFRAAGSAAGIFTRLCGAAGGHAINAGILEIETEEG